MDDPVSFDGLCLLCGVAFGRAQTSDRSFPALVWRQLAANFLWSPLFFRWELYLAALAWLAVIIVLILVTMARFRRVDRKAGLLIVPYLCWVLFAGYLNAGVWLLNR